MVGKQDEADAKLGAIKDKILRLKAMTATQGKGVFVMVTGGKVLAFGPDSRFDWVYSDLGVPAAIGATEGDNHGEPISFEFLKEINPDWVFVLDRDAAIGKKEGAAKALLNNDVVNSINAAQKDQIVYLDGYSWYMVGYGLTAVDNAISDIYNAYNR
jgi:iron complex transport system substrate-binding protein